MPTNRDPQAARQFHDATKYVLVNEGQEDEDLWLGSPPQPWLEFDERDPALSPLPYKIYTSLTPLALPHDVGLSHLPALDALAATGDLPGARAIPDRATLARLCLLSNGILKTGSHGTGRVIEYRAAGGTGARYHLELYLVCADLPDLDAGVYHYGAHDHRLRRLRTGDFRAVLVEATGAEPSLVEAPVVVVASSTFWRNAVRYQGRAYRHVYWDLGTLLSNLLAVAAAAALPARVVLGFAEAAVNQLLGIDGARESAVGLVALGRDRPPSTVAPALRPVDAPTQPLSEREIVFPAITAMHAASSLTSGDEAATWRSRQLRRALPAPAADVRPVQPLAAADIPAAPIEAVIRQRRSTRHYAVDAPVSFVACSTLLDRSSRGVAMDCRNGAGGPLSDQYLIVNNVAGLEPGTYVLQDRHLGLERLAGGDMRAAAARLASGQSYAADGAVNVYYLADLEPILERYGNRGYRIAQLEAAIYAGKLHLAAHALGLGAVGSTALDDEVIQFFSPHAAGKSYLFVIVFGQRRPRKAQP